MTTRALVISAISLLRFGASTHAAPGPAAVELDREDAPAGRTELGFDGGAPLPGWGVSIGVGYLARPLTLDNGTSVPITRRSTLVLGGAVALGTAAVLDVRLPLARQSGDGLAAFGDPRPVDRWVAGDLRLAGRVRVAGSPERAVFARAALTLPTGDEGDFAGEPSSGVAIGLIARITLPGAIVVAATGGIHVRAVETALGDRLVGNELVGGVGLVVPLPVIEPLWFDRTDVRLTGELVGALGDNVDGMLGPSPLEARLGLVTRPTESLAIGVRAGAGLNDQIGSPRWRIMVEVAWQGTWQLVPPRAANAGELSEDATEGP